MNRMEGTIKQNQTNKEPHIYSQNFTLPIHFYLSIGNHNARIIILFYLFFGKNQNVKVNQTIWGVNIVKRLSNKTYI